MSRRLLLVLALGAALVGAPLRVFGATNLLLVPQVSPTSGTTATTFTFSVRYEGRFPAVAAAATAGTTTVTLARVAGTSTDGTWRGSSRLPAGTWSVTFAAVADQGNAASLVGPTVVVVAGSQPTTARSSWSPPSSSGGAGGTAVDATASDAGGTTTSSPPPDVAPVQPNAAAASTPVAAPAATPAAASPGELPGGSTPHVDAAPGGSASASPAAEALRVAQSDDSGGTALVLALVGLALVAISGSALLVIADRRRRSATPDGETLDATAAVVEHRALRRARMRLDEDPIVAAMGLPDSAAAAERRVRRAAKKDRAR